MIHFGAAGVFGAPAADKAAREPEADRFREGDVWLNSQGTSHRVLRVQGRVAHLFNERTQRTVSKPWDGVGAHTGRPWVRVSCGEQPAARASAPREGGGA